MKYTIYGVWRSSTQRQHIKDTQVGDRFEDWYYGAIEHDTPKMWLDLNNAHRTANGLTRAHDVDGFTYQVREFGP